MNGGIVMKQRQGIMTLIFAAVLSIGLLGGFTSTADVSAKQTVKVVKVQKVATKAYRATKGYMYNSPKLTKKIHNLKNYPKTTFYSKKRVTIKTTNNKTAYYTYVANKSGKIKGYVYSKYLKLYQPTKTTSTSSSNSQSDNSISTPQVISKSSLSSLIAASPDLDPTGELLSLTSADYKTYQSVFNKNFNVGNYADEGVFTDDQASIYVKSPTLQPYVQKAIDKWNTALGTTVFTLGTAQNHSLPLGFGNGQSEGWDGVFDGDSVQVDYYDFHDRTYPYGPMPLSSSQTIQIKLSTDDTDVDGAAEGMAATRVKQSAATHRDTSAHYLTTTVSGTPTELLENYWVGVITHELGHALGLDHTPYFQDIMAAPASTEDGQSQENAKYDWTTYKDSDNVQGGALTATLSQRDIDRAKLTKLLGYW